MFRAVARSLPLLLCAIARLAVAQPADCATEGTPAGVIPLALGLAGRPGVPKGTTGKAFVAVPVGPGVACRDRRPPPRDILRGDLGGRPEGEPRETNGAPQGETGGAPSRAADDDLLGPADDVLHGPSALDLLRGGYGAPHVRVEQLRGGAP